MPTYLDIHDLPGVKAGAVVGAHEADVRVQGAYGVDYKHYWVDEEAGKVIYLVDAPDRDTAALVHREAHGLEATPSTRSPRAPDPPQGRLTHPRTCAWSR